MFELEIGTSVLFLFFFAYFAVFLYFPVYTFSKTIVKVE